MSKAEGLVITDEVEARMRTVKREAEESAVKLNRLVDMLVDKYAKDLDDYVDLMRERLRRGNELSELELETATLKIPIFMYYAASGQETLGGEGDNATVLKKDAYNKAYLEFKGTINDKTAFAELETVPEYMVEVAFQRAYRKLKQKVEKASDIFSGVKKVLSKRMLEIEVAHRELPYQQNRDNRRNTDDD